MNNPLVYVRVSFEYGFRLFCRKSRTRPKIQSGFGEIWAGPVPVDLAGTRPVPRFFYTACFFKVAKRTVENRYSSKSENVTFHEI